MLNNRTTPNQRRQQFRADLASGRLLRFPGALNPLSSLLIEELGFEGIYISGAVLSADLGLPDIGLTTLSEVAHRGQEIARVSSLPTLLDADTGFGEPMNAARTMQTLEDAGIAGCHIEDQINPKRCGQLEGKAVVPVEEMTRRIAAAVGARRDPDFVLCARTDSRALEGIDAAIDRAKAYIDAGADMVFPEALLNPGEYETFRKAIDVPMLANMTEFGQAELLTAETLASIGVNVVIYPVTLLRIAMGAIESGLRQMLAEGTQKSLLGGMQTRTRLYELVDYAGYASFDEGIYNFSLGKDRG